MNVVVLADTHIPDGSGRELDDRVLRAAARADLILHAGDVTGPELLRQLHELAPVRAVAGNNDRDLDELPDRLELDLDGVSVAMVHDSGTAKGRPARLRRWFPDAELVVFGHSHMPQDLAADGVRIFNPGSCTQRRRAPSRTYGRLDLSDGEIVGADLVHL